MKLAMYQMENAGSIPENLTKSIHAIKTAAEHGAIQNRLYMQRLI